MQTFEDLLKSRKLKPFQQEEVRTIKTLVTFLLFSILNCCCFLQGLSELTQGLKSLERGYLLTKDDYKLLQQQGVEICDFDPER